MISDQANKSMEQLKVNSPAKLVVQQHEPQSKTKQLNSESFIENKYLFTEKKLQKLFPV